MANRLPEWSREEHHHLDELENALKMTLQYHLRELRANAVVDAVNFGRNQVKYFLRSSEDILQQIEQYADRIRQEK